MAFCQSVRAGWAVSLWGHSNPNSCNWICLNFLHSQALGMQNIFLSHYFALATAHASTSHLVKLSLPNICFNSRMRTARSSLYGGRGLSNRDPLDRDPRTKNPPWTETSLWSCDLWCMLGQRPPFLWTEWHTGVKTLPCRNFVAGGNNLKYTFCASWTAQFVDEFPAQGRGFGQFLDFLS